MTIFLYFTGDGFDFVFWFCFWFLVWETFNLEKVRLEDLSSSYWMKKQRIRISSKLGINCKDTVLLIENVLLGNTWWMLPLSWRNQKELSCGNGDRHRRPTSLPSSSSPAGIFVSLPVWQSQQLSRRRQGLPVTQQWLRSGQPRNNRCTIDYRGL